MGHTTLWNTCGHHGSHVLPRHTASNTLVFVMASMCGRCCTHSKGLHGGCIVTLSKLCVSPCACTHQDWPCRDTVLASWWSPPPTFVMLPQVVSLLSPWGGETEGCVSV
jgi:hypothetical protein